MRRRVPENKIGRYPLRVGIGFGLFLFLSRLKKEQDIMTSKVISEAMYLKNNSVVPDVVDIECTEIEEVRTAVNKWLKLKNDTVVDVILACVIANKFETDPLWMFLISPPSGAKTELLRALDSEEIGVRFISKITEHTLVSGLKKKGVDLLRKLDGKVLALKDFTTILTIRRESRQEIFSQLREIYDGKYDQSWGTGKDFHWEGKIGLIAGVTPEIEKYHSVHQLLGERFLYYRIEHYPEEKTGKKALRNIGFETTMRKELKAAVKSFLCNLQGIDISAIHVSEEMKNKIVDLACFTAAARTGVSRDRYTHIIEYTPEPELPGRLTKQFYQLACALATVRKKLEVEPEEYQVIKKVAMDCLPRQRWLLMKKLKEIEAGSVNDISLATKCPYSTTKLLLEDLNALELVDVTPGNRDLWGLSRKTLNYLKAIG
jgi:hypothetical protein